jgi:hypothetical protein
MFVFLFLKTGITFRILGRKDSQDNTPMGSHRARPTTAAAFRCPTQGSSSPTHHRPKTQRARRDRGPAPRQVHITKLAAARHLRAPRPPAPPGSLASQAPRDGDGATHLRAPGARTPPRFPGEGHELLITTANGRRHPPFPSPRLPPCLAPSRNSSATTQRVALP